MPSMTLQHLFSGIVIDKAWYIGMQRSLNAPKECLHTQSSKPQGCSGNETWID